jgi:predicted ATPase
MFTRMRVEGWRQFGKVELAFHPRLTVLTGANASGKTTLLQVLGMHFNWVVPLLGVPIRDRRGRLTYVSGLRRAAVADQPIRSIGEIEYDSGIVADLQVGEEVSNQYNISISNQQQLPGLSIPSHRSYYAYQPVETIPTQFNPVDQVLQQYVAELYQRYLGSPSPTQKSPMYWMKLTLIEAGLFGQQSQSVIPNQEAREVFEGFEQVLRQLFPPSMGFERIALQPPDVLIETQTGRFPIDAVSGGMSALMEVAWQVFLRSRGTESFTVDEPENHLHPELQRLVIPAFLESFPSIQFIVATHSPFIVSSVPDSNVYVLQYDETHHVFAELLDQVNKAASSNQILRDVLGLEMTMPIWAQRRIESIIDRYSAQPVTELMLDDLRNELSSLGMEEAFPGTARDVLEREGIE